jgi:hypothetical protein
MTITIPVSQEEQAILADRARAQGVSVDTLLRKVVLQIISAAPDAAMQEHNGEQWQKEFEQWIDALPDLPVLPNKALSRESLYMREDECL